MLCGPARAASAACLSAADVAIRCVHQVQVLCPCPGRESQPDKSSGVISNVHRRNNDSAGSPSWSSQKSEMTPVRRGGIKVIFKDI